MEKPTQLDDSYPQIFYDIFLSLLKILFVGLSG